jgi:hypothetical protein
MEKHHRELARDLFVLATELLEDTHSVATDGHSAHLDKRQCASLSAKLDVAAQQLVSVAAALQALAAYSGPLPRVAGQRRRKSIPKRKPSTP